MKKHNVSQRYGSSATEVIVAATLLLSMIGFVIPTTIRAGRILRDARHYQMAMNELSNQFEYLSSLSEDERATALTQLHISDQTRQSLSNANLEANLAAKGDGVRLTLSISWDRGAESKPIMIVGWLSSAVADPETAREESEFRKEDSNETT